MPVIEGSEATGYLVIYHDISELQRQKQYYESLLEMSPAAIMTVDPDAKVTSWNPAAERMLGWRAEELVGHDMHSIVHHTHPDGTPYPDHDCPIYAAFRDGLLARLLDEVVELRLRLVVGLLDPRRVDPAVLDQLVERQLRDLSANAVERREHDRLRRVVDDEVDAGEVLQRADVAALPADDPALHVVGGQLDDRDRRLGGMAGGDALQGVGDEVPRPPLRLAPRLPYLFVHERAGADTGRHQAFAHQPVIGNRDGGARHTEAPCQLPARGQQIAGADKVDDQLEITGK